MHISLVGYLIVASPILEEIKGFEDGLYLEASAPDGTAFINSWTFKNLMGSISKNFIHINNTGNNDFDQINITGANLIQIGGAAEIAIGRFFVNITNNTLGNGMPLTTSAQTIRAAITLAGEEISNATLMHGPSSIGETPIYPGVADFYSKGNQTLLFWLDLPLGLPSGTYNNTWNLTVVDLG